MDAASLALIRLRRRGLRGGVLKLRLLHTISTWMTPGLHHWVSTMTAGGATANDLEGLSRPAGQAAGCARPGTIRLHEGRIGPCESALTKFKSGMFAYNGPFRLGGYGMGPIIRM